MRGENYLRFIKTNYKKIIWILIIIIGISLILFPTISNLINDSNSNNQIDEYNKAVSGLTDDEKSNMEENASKYNSTGNSNYYNALNLGEVISYIEIPKINVYLPIYNDTSEKTLSVAIGHLERTSLPVGGKGTHCVLTGHSGLTTNKLFTDLDKLEVGDTFTLHTLDKKLVYKVTNIEIILPDDVYYNCEYDKDQCTLVTCTPIGINTHRLCVRAERTEN
jgi:sortase A